MSGPEVVDPRATGDRATGKPAVTERASEDRGLEREASKRLLQQLGIQPGGTTTSRLTTPPLSIEEWATQQQRQEGGDLKERIYRDLVFSINAARRASIDRMRSDPDLAPFAGICDEILGVVATITFTVIGMIGGGVEILLRTIPSLLQLVYGTIKLLGNAVQGLTGGERGKRSRVEVNETIANLRKLPTALREHFQEWRDRFEKAPTERQSIMIGELTAEVIALLGAAVGAARGAGQIGRFTIPKLALQTTPDGALAIARVGEAVVEVPPTAAAAGALAASTALRTAGKTAGGSTPATQATPKVRTPGKVLRREPTLKDAGWGPRPPGAYNNRAAEAYASAVTKSKESLYVGKRWVEFDGYRSLEELGLTPFAGYRRADKFLLDAKLAQRGGMYDLTVTNPLKEAKVFSEAIRQGNAWVQSGAAGIMWIVSDEAVVLSLRKFFRQKQIGIKVIYQAP